MNPLSRRSFLKASAQGAAALSLSRAGLAAAPAGKPGFRLFACDWTMKKTSDPGSFALAKSLGLDGVQVDFGRLAPGESRPPLLAPTHQDRILAASRETGVAIASLAFGVLNSIPYKSAPETESWVLDGLPVAKKLGVSVILLAFFSKNDLVDDPAGIQESIRRLKRIAPRAADLGVTLGLESWLKVDALEPILAAVNSPAVQVYYDVGNLHKVGEDYGAGIFVEFEHVFALEFFGGGRVEDFDAVVSRDEKVAATVVVAQGAQGFGDPLDEFFAGHSGMCFDGVFQ